MKHIFKRETSERNFLRREASKGSFPQDPLFIVSYDDKPHPQPNRDLCLHPP